MKIKQHYFSNFSKLKDLVKIVDQFIEDMDIKSDNLIDIKYFIDIESDWYQAIIIYKSE